MKNRGIGEQSSNQRPPTGWLFVIILLKVHLLSNCSGITIPGRLFLLRQFQAAAESSTPPSGGDGQRVKAQAAGASTWLQRPETARGRRFPTARAQPGEAQPSEHKLIRPLQDEGKGRFQTVRQKKKEEKKSSESDSSLAETKEKRAMDREVEKKRELLVREKDKRMQLLREEVKREEEVEEESEEGQR